MSKLSGNLYAGLSGIELTEDSIELGEGILLRKTYAHLMAPFIMAFKPAPPNKPHPSPWKSASGGFSFDITAEIKIPSDLEHNFGSLLGIARTLIFLFRLGINPAITFPIISNCSFSKIPQYPDNSAYLIPYEVQPRHFPLGIAGTRVENDSLIWLKESWQVTHKLRKSCDKFSLSVDAFDSGQFIDNSALILVSLWGALESLFSPSTTELKFRVSSLIAAYLDLPGENRAKRQKEIAKLYDKRSAAAHGKPSHNSEHVLKTFNLLREVLLEIIDRGSTPTNDYLEEKLFGSTI